MAQETKPNDATKQVAQTLYAGKYATPEDLAAAYEELTHKVGQQGNELGSLRDKAAKAEQMEQLATQYYQQAAQAAPYQQWFLTNKDKVLHWLQQENQQTQQHAAQTDATMPFSGDELARLEERIRTNVLAPYDQQITQRAAEIQQTVLNRVQQAMQGQTKFIYDRIARGLPEEKRQELERLIEIESKYLNPQDKDTSKWAEEALQMERDKLNLESQLKERETEMDKLRAQLAPPSLNGHPGSLFGEGRPDLDGPADKELAMREKILKEVQDASGDTYSEVFHAPR